MILLDTVIQDLRQGVRLLFRNVAFTFVAVLALSLGIGVNTALFTAYRAMVLRPLDARSPEEMVNLALLRQSGAAEFAFSYPDYEEYRNTSRSFSALVAFRMERLTMSDAGNVVSQRAATADTTLRRLGLLSAGTGNAEFANTFVVSENYFAVLDVQGIRGRTFESLGTSGLLAAPSVLVSENYLQRRFGGNGSLLGRTIRLNGAAVTVIGITPLNFMGTGAVVPDFWLPMCLAPLIHADENWLRDRESGKVRLFGRLAPGVSVERAQAEMTVLAERVQALHARRSASSGPATALVWGGSPFPLPLKMYPGLNLAILLTMAAAALVLVVACANVGSLQLARSSDRVSELRTRLSLGASRARLVTQLLTENAVLGLAAAAVALLFTWALLRVAVTLLTGVLPPEYGTLVFDVTPDLTIFAYVLAIALAATILFGLAPALESTRTALAQSARGSTTSSRNRRLQDLFVGAQVALALVLLIAGSMLIRSSINALRTDPGYDSGRLVGLVYEFPEAARYSVDRKRAVLGELRARLASLPAVAEVTSARPPGDSPFQTAAIALDSGNDTAVNQQVLLHYSHVQPDYFRTVGIPLVLGPGFEGEGGRASQSVVLSESAARLLWPGQRASGRSLRLGATDGRPHARSALTADGPAYQVVGVVKDIRGVEFDGSNSSHVYLVLPDDRLQEYPLLIRVKTDPARVLAQLDPLLSSVDPELVASASTLDEMLRQSGPFIVSTLSAAVSSTVGLVALLLALMGIHGTVSYMVVHRTREVGIRMALGAQKHDVVGLVLRDATRPVLFGLLAGIVFAVGASRLLRSVLYGMTTVDGVSFIGVGISFLAVALIAAFVPARRAATVDPGVALRYE